MTRICPGLIPETCRAPFSSMDTLAALLAPLAPTNSFLSLLDLTLLRPILAQKGGIRFLTALLSPAETRLFASFTYPKRRLEWLGGRLAAKHGLSRLLASSLTYYRDYSLVPNAHGRPHLDPPSNQEHAPAISISHSRGYAAALVITTAGGCGIDIQQKTGQLVKVQERFTSREELAILDRIPDPITRLGMIWTAKEAVKKYLLSDHPAFFGTIRLTEITSTETESIWTVRCEVTAQNKTLASVRIAEFDDYLIACTAGEVHA